MKRQIFRFENLGKNFSGNWVFKNISGVVYEGDKIALFGENGAGKTTLLLLLSGILKPNQGKVIQYNQKLGLITHEIMFYPHMSVWDNLLFFGQITHLSKKEATYRIKETLKFFNLYDRRFDLPTTFSRGMLQRLMWARLAVTQSQVLILDEAFSSLDVAWQKTLFSCLKNGGISELNWNFHTYLIVEHDLDFMKPLCNISWALKDKQLLTEAVYGI